MWRQQLQDCWKRCDAAVDLRQVMFIVCRWTRWDVVIKVTLHLLCWSCLIQNRMPTSLTITLTLPLTCPRFLASISSVYNLLKHLLKYCMHVLFTCNLLGLSADFSGQCMKILIRDMICIVTKSVYDFYCMMHCSAKHGLAIACRLFCLHLWHPPTPRGTWRNFGEKMFVQTYVHNVHLNWVKLRVTWS